MNEVITREALQVLFSGETLFAVPEPIAVPVVVAEAAPQSEAPVVATPEPAPEPLSALPPVAEVPAAPATAPTLAFRHQLLVLTDRPSPDDLALLENILKAVSLRLDKVELLDLQKLKGQDFRPLLESKAAHLFISFGVGLKKLNLDLVLVPYRVTPIEGIQFLLTDPLAQLHTDKAKKKALWINLQVLFGLA